jgi:hypothetical protein
VNFRRARIAGGGGVTNAPWLRPCAAISAAFLFTGCLDSTPQYSVPPLIPPVISTPKLVPLTSGIQPLTTSQLRFTIPFRSDDLGKDLFATFVLDFDPALDPASAPGALTQFDVPADPRPFSQQDDRDFEWLWTSIDLTLSGCHTVTMILSHRDNYTGGYGTNDPNDVAQVTWVFDIENVNDPESMSHLIIDCPLNAGSNPGTPH